MTETATNRDATRGPARCPASLALDIAGVAERLRSDPAANFEPCAVRWALEILHDRAGARLSEAM